MGFILVVVFQGVINSLLIDKNHSAPANNNAALTILRNVVVTGFYTGILVNEHTDGENINLACNFNGLEFPFAHHAAHFGRVCAQRCTHGIAVTGQHGFSIEQLDIEIAGKKQTNRTNEWQATKFDISDPPESRRRRHQLLGGRGRRGGNREVHRQRWRHHPGQKNWLHPTRKRVNWSGTKRAKAAKYICPAIRRFCLFKFAGN